MEQTNTIQSFTDLKVWQESHGLSLNLYRVSGTFPEEEKYGLTSQLRRAAISISSNIAEGFARASYKDKLRFYYMAVGSLVELQSQLLLARDLGYLSQDVFAGLALQIVSIHKMINAFITKTKSYIPDSKF